MKVNIKREQLDYLLSLGVPVTLLPPCPIEGVDSRSSSSLPGLKPTDKGSKPPLVRAAAVAAFAVAGVFLLIRMLLV
jgi:hypothetical protein